MASRLRHDLDSRELPARQHRLEHPAERRAYLTAVERIIRVQVVSGDPYPDFRRLIDLVDQDPGKALDLLDYMIGTAVHPESRAASDLNESFAEAGSRWRVNTVGKGLCEIIDPAVEKTAEAAAAADPHAGVHLANAWNSAFGRSKNADHAYDQAIKSVEAAAQKVLTPTDQTATLGKMISAIRDNPTKWVIALPQSDGSNPMSRVAEMMDILWRSHVRHGSAVEEARTGHTIEEAQAAIPIAAALVHLFGSGAVFRTK